MLSQANSRGQQGYALVSVNTSINGQNMYYKDSAHANATISYASGTRPGDITALLALLNSRGSDGWAFKHDSEFYTSYQQTLFVKDSRNPSIYVYSHMPANGLGWSEALSKLNERGAVGERYLTSVRFGVSVSSPMSYIFMQSSTPPATYSYSIRDRLPEGSGVVAMRALLAEEGANRRLFLGLSVPDDLAPMATSALFFETSSLQSTALEYDVVQVQTFEAQHNEVARHNAKAREGYVYLGRHQIPPQGGIGPGVTMAIYVKNLQFPLVLPGTGLVYPGP